MAKLLFFAMVIFIITMITFAFLAVWNFILPEYPVTVEQALLFACTSVIVARIIDRM